MHAMTEMLLPRHRLGAPTREAEAIDAQIAERQSCPRCGGSVHYEGYHRQDNGCHEYIALAVGNRCGQEISF